MDEIIFDASNEWLQKIIKEFSEYDEFSHIILKGHLLLEQLMTAALEDFFLHGEFVEKTQLSFANKLLLCRGCSTSDQNNPMWTIIGKLNAIRNKVAHSLDPEDRDAAIQSLKPLYQQELREVQVPEFVKHLGEEIAMCATCIIACLGYLQAFNAEIKRLKEIIVALDQTMNDGSLS